MAGTESLWAYSLQSMSFCCQLALSWGSSCQTGQQRSVRRSLGSTVRNRASFWRPSQFQGDLLCTQLGSLGERPRGSRRPKCRRLVAERRLDSQVVREEASKRAAEKERLGPSQSARTGRGRFPAGGDTRKTRKGPDVGSVSRIWVREGVTPPVKRNSRDVDSAAPALTQRRDLFAERYGPLSPGIDAHVSKAVEIMRTAGSEPAVVQMLESLAETSRGLVVTLFSTLVKEKRVEDCLQV